MYGIGHIDYSDVEYDTNTGPAFSTDAEDADVGEPDVGCTDTDGGYTYGCPETVYVQYHDGEAEEQPCDGTIEVRKDAGDSYFATCPECGEDVLMEKVSESSEDSTDEDDEDSDDSKRPHAFGGYVGKTIDNFESDLL